MPVMNEPRDGTRKLPSALLALSLLRFPYLVTR